eukprot:scaffold5.g654.t1
MASSISGQRCPALGGLVFIQGEAVEVPNEHYPVLLEFWATWCKICPKAWPHMTEVHHKYRDRGLRVVGVCVEPDSPTVRRYCEDHARDMPYAQAIDSRGDAYALMQRAQRNDVPHAFLIDTAGMIRRVLAARTSATHRYHSNPMRLQFAVEVSAQAV